MSHVSIVTEMELESIGTCEIQGNCHQRFSKMEHNLQDPHYMGTVVFCGRPFPKMCLLAMDELLLIMESYPKSFDQYWT